MLLGLSARQICKLTTGGSSIEPADLEGLTPPPVGSANPMLSIGTSSLVAWRYSVNWTAGTSTLTGPTTLPGVTFSRACGGGTCIPQPGTSQQLDSLGDRLNYRLAFVEATSEGLRLHDAVQGAIVERLRALDPERFRRYRAAADVRPAELGEQAQGLP